VSLIDPNLLQLIGLGSKGDQDLPDGRHLRWIFNRLLGFPRSGFRLTRRPSLLTIDFDAPPQGTPPIRSQLTRQLELGGGARTRFPSGLTVSKAVGFAYGPADSGGSPLLRLDDRVVALDFGAEGTPIPVAGELLSNPAAYVLVTIARRRRTGFAVATGYYDGRPTRRLVDRAAVGGDLRSHLFDIAVDVTQFGTTQRMLSSAERIAGYNAVTNRDALALAALTRQSVRPRWPRPPIADPNYFVTETLLLHGGLLEHIELRGRDANLVRVQWVSCRDLLAARDWTELNRYFLPLTDAPDIYPAWTADPGEKVAGQRLQEGAPNRQPPWDREDGGNPARLLASVPASVMQSLEARYLGAEFKPVDLAMREFLKGEVTQIVPQALVQITERLEPEPGDTTGPEAMDVTVSPFDLLYAASADPQVARELGLSALDVDDPVGIYDYAIEAGFATLWAQWVLTPTRARERAEELRADLAGRPAEWKDRREFAPFSVASVVTGLKQTAAVSIEAPADLRVDVIPDATHHPVQARARVHWERSAATLFEAPDRVRILHAFTRASGAGDLLLHHRDDESKLLAPHLPTPYGEPQPRFNLVDRSLPSYGDHTWQVTAMDLFGRLSPAAAISAEVRDTISPPAPATVDVQLLGDATTGPSWTAVAITFDWLPSHEAIAPDLAAFEIHLRQGVVSSADAPLPATWGRFETTPGSVASAVTIAWPGLAVSNPLPGVTVAPSAAPIAGGGTRVTITASPVAVPFDATGRAHIAAAIRAVDDWENTSGFAVGRAERVDMTIPPPPSFDELAQRATPPDAQNRSWFSVPLPVLDGGTVRVQRATSAALLASAGTTADDFAALDEQQQVGLLRALSVTHREPFATDHEQPVPADGGGYPLELGGSDRGLTVVHLVIESRTGTRSHWPTTPAPFMVIAVPRTAAPPTPLVSELHVGDRDVSLSIAPDITCATRTLALYRARTADDATDVRRMRPVIEDALPAPDEPTVLLDTDLFDEVDYFYRVVAIGDDGQRSAPTIAVRVRPVSQSPPPAVVVLSVLRDPAAPGLRRVALTIPRRDYPIFLFRRRQFALAWETPSAAGVDVEGRLDFSSLATTPIPDGYQVSVDDAVPADDVGWSYVARIEDPRGRITMGVPVMETP
jgi:hypothetical protein